VNALHTAFAALQASAQKINDTGARFELQKHIMDGVEVIVGLKRDPQFGVMCMLGAGGVMANLMDDKNLMLASNNEVDIRALIESSKIGKVLMGYRGQKGYAIGALVSTIQKLVRIGKAFPRIKELEINPVIVTREEAWAVDTKIVLES
jgi:succinyl-CoA synthetase beta subunit